MRRLVPMIAILILVLVPLSIGAEATTAQDIPQLSQGQEITYYADGSYTISTLSAAPAKASIRTGSRSISFYNSKNEKQWTIAVSGTFSYNGSTATCTASSVSYTIHESIWKMSSATASRSGASAIGDFTVKRYLLLIPVQTENVRVTVSCSPSGVLS